MHDLPPLKALRAFEACYRLRSFTRAAQTLNVGQPAISHQIRLLEKDLGAKLFEKHGATIRPTEAAHSYYTAVAQAFFNIAEASREVRRGEAFGGATLITYPGVAAFWASPRIARLGDSAPDAAIRIVTAERDSDISLAQADCAILFGRGDWPGCEVLHLLPERVCPVALPALAERFAEATPEEMLEQAPLIHLEDAEERWFTWEDWRRRFAPRAQRINRRISVSNHGLAIHQALAGHGVALCWIGVVESLIEGGSLIPLQETPLVSDRGYWLVARPGFLESEAGWQIKQALAPAPENAPPS